MEKELVEVLKRLTSAVETLVEQAEVSEAVRIHRQLQRLERGVLRELKSGRITEFEARRLYGLPDDWLTLVEGGHTGDVC